METGKDPVKTVGKTGSQTNPTMPNTVRTVDTVTQVVFIYLSNNSTAKNSSFKTEAVITCE